MFFHLNQLFCGIIKIHFDIFTVTHFCNIIQSYTINSRRVRSFDEMKESGDYSYLNDYWNDLENEEDVIKVFNTIHEIIEGVR